MRRRFPPLLLLGVLCLSGCVWLRLLDVREQLKDFDRYFLVSDPPGLALTFREPVLLADDLKVLLKAGPTGSATIPALEPALEDGGEQTFQIYRFQKALSVLGPEEETAERHLELRTHLINGTLVTVTFPPAVFRAIDRDLAIALLRAMGRAKVDTAQQSAETSLPSDVSVPPPPTRAALHELFGCPNAVGIGKDGFYQESFLYQLVPGADAGPEDKPVYALMVFQFGAEAYQPAVPGALTRASPTDVQIAALLNAQREARPTTWMVQLGGMWLRVRFPPAKTTH
jgi:hypothetical protein